MVRLQGEGWRGYREKDGEDTGRRMVRIHGEGWRGYMEKDGKIQGVGWSDTGSRIE